MVSSLCIGPRTFVGPPFERCPACGAPDSLGLLTVRRASYLKRCTECLREQRRELPRAPTPRVLYLDQFAISNLAKALMSEPPRECWRPDRLRGLGDDNQGQEVSGRGS